MATSASTVAAAVVARARREVREHFDRSNAFDPGHAVAYDPPNSMHRRQFEHLIGCGILREAGESRYWIDREAEKRKEERRRAAALLIFKIILIGVALAVAAVAILKAVR